MKLVVGLGNPGAKYRGTRHNIGFAIADEVARRQGAEFDASPVDALVARVRGESPFLVAKPVTFMNASGEAVGEIARYYKIDAPDVLVVVDEIQLPLGRIRVRAHGSAGGHNVLKSVIQHLGSGFPRLRIGVGRGDPRWDLADHVLSKFTRAERDEVDAAIARAADAAETFVRDGIDQAMNRFNAAGD